MSDKAEDGDRIIRIRCDMCEKKFACRHTDIARKFMWGSFCSDKCREGLIAVLKEHY